MNTPVPDFPRLLFGRESARTGDVFCLHVNPSRYVTPSAMEEPIYDDGGSVTQALRAYARFLEVVEVLPKNWSVLIAAPRRGTRKLIAMLHVSFCTKKDIGWCIRSLGAEGRASKYLRDRSQQIKDCLVYLQAGGYAIPS